MVFQHTKGKETTYYNFLFVCRDTVAPKQAFVTPCDVSTIFLSFLLCGHFVA